MEQFKIRLILANQEGSCPEYNEGLPTAWAVVYTESSEVCLTGVAGVYPEFCAGTATGTNRSLHPGREALSSLASAQDRQDRLRELPSLYPGRSPFPFVTLRVWTGSATR